MPTKTAELLNDLKKSLSVLKDDNIEEIYTYLQNTLKNNKLFPYEWHELDELISSASKIISSQAQNIDTKIMQEQVDEFIMLSNRVAGIFGPKDTKNVSTSREELVNFALYLSLPVALALAVSSLVISIPGVILSSLELFINLGTGHLDETDANNTVVNKVYGRISQLITPSINKFIKTTEDNVTIFKAIDKDYAKNKLASKETFKENCSKFKERLQEIKVSGGEPKPDMANEPANDFEKKPPSNTI